MEGSGCLLPFGDRGCLRDATTDVPLGLMIIFDIFRPFKQSFLKQLIPVFTRV